MELIPVEGDGEWVPEQAAAEDASAAVAYALRCRQNGQGQEAAWAARVVYEAHDTFVIQSERIDINDRGAGARVLAHPVIQAEFARQRRDLDDLAQMSDARAAAARLRARAMSEGVVFAWAR